VALSGSIQEFVRLTASDGKTYALCLNTDGTFVVRNITDGLNVFIAGATADAVKTGSNATIWHANNDGPGSGLDADTVDGKQATALVQVGTGNQAATPVQLVVVGPTSAALPAAGTKGRIGIVATGVTLP
jgi:hypothetical protein